MKVTKVAETKVVKVVKDTIGDGMKAPYYVCAHDSMHAVVHRSVPRRGTGVWCCVVAIGFGREGLKLRVVQRRGKVRP